MKSCATIGELLANGNLLPEQNMFARFKEIAFADLKIDSRNVKPGDIFVATRAASYFQQAEQAGAAAILVDADDFSSLKKRPQLALPLIPIDDLEKKLPELAQACYSFPSLSIIGVTGTNGKSSVASLAAQLLQNSRNYDSPINSYSVAVIGTLGAAIAGATTAETGMTTPDILTCYRLLSNFADEGVDTVAMEVSSHGLSQNRVAGLPITTAVFTNLTQDHLDYHESFEAYSAAKQKLFRLPSLKTAIVNVDDDYHSQMIDQTTANNIIKIGIQKNADVMAKNITALPNGMIFDLHSPWGRANIQSPLLGVFNIYNLLCAFSAAMVQGGAFSQLVKAIFNIQPILGRMQLLPMVDDVQTIVDFAHTPDGLEQALKAVKSHTLGRIWCVFGCGGDRDTQKRALMGAIADETADEVILTSDNPRSENPNNIIRAIASGCKTTPRVLTDRKEAIRFAVENAGKGDTILIAGKGHESFQLIGDKKIPFSDAAIATEALIERQQKMYGEILK